jgi:hypothetical protein
VLIDPHSNNAGPVSAVIDAPTEERPVAGISWSVGSAMLEQYSPLAFCYYRYFSYHPILAYQLASLPPVFGRSLRVPVEPQWAARNQTWWLSAVGGPRKSSGKVRIEPWRRLK